MFEGFARVWTPVAMAEQLTADKPLAIELAGTPVVLFRDQASKPVALVDRCPHRGVKLSLGKVERGCIECPFHGWRLDGDGRVRHVPWNPDARLDTLHGTPLPARELAGQLWVYTDPLTAPPSEPQAHEALTRPGVRVSGFSVDWDTHWTRAMENMLDWPHLPYVHRKTIGRAMKGQTSSRMDVLVDERPWGFETRITIDGTPEPASLDLRWPNQMNLHISPPGKVMIQAVACVPIGENRTRMLLVMARDFMTSRWLDWAFHWMNARIANEDRAIVESSFPAAVPLPRDEQSVRSDGPTLLFRKRYLAELAGSRADEPAPRRRALPVTPRSS